MPFKDPEKRREFRREWYAKNKNSEKLLVKKRKTRLKKWFEDYKKTVKCSKCGESHPATLDFHHIHQKQENISYLLANGYSKERILEEIKNCEILCANCHRKFHYKTKNFKTKKT